MDKRSIKQAMHSLNGAMPPPLSIERGDVVRVSGVLFGGVTYSLEGAAINGLSRVENMEDGVYCLKYKTRARVEFHFFLLAAEQLTYLASTAMRDITDGRIERSRFDADVLPAMQSGPVRRFVPIFDQADREAS